MSSRCARIERRNREAIWNRECLERCGPLSRGLAVFEVIDGCEQDLTLGCDYLTDNEILTKRKHLLRIQPREYAEGPFFKLLGSSGNVVSGTIGGSSVNSFVDTGADENIISARLAAALGLKIDTGPGTQVLFRRADGRMIAQWESCGRWTGHSQRTAARTRKSFTSSTSTTTSFSQATSYLASTRSYNTPIFSTSRRARPRACTQLRAFQPVTAIAPLALLPDLVLTLPLPSPGRLGSTSTNPAKVAVHRRMQAAEAEHARHTEEELRILALPASEQAAARREESRRQQLWQETFETERDTGQGPIVGAAGERIGEVADGDGGDWGGGDAVVVAAAAGQARLEGHAQSAPPTSSTPMRLPERRLSWKRVARLFARWRRTASDAQIER